MYARRHAPSRPSPDDDRSLFVNNVPVDSTEPHFRALTAALVGNGKFESIKFEAEISDKTVSYEPAQADRLAAAASRKRKRDSPQSEDKEEEVAQLPSTWSRQVHRSGSMAVIVLADEKSVGLVLKAIAKLHKTKKYPVWGEGLKADVPPLGSEWLSEHHKLMYPPAGVLQQSVDAFFTAYNRKEKEAEELAKKMRKEPDEDGFVTVTRGGRAPPARREEAEEARRKMLDREQKKKDELVDFYRFQLRERKKAEHAELMKKFDEDRKTVEAMKRQRGKFRPET